VRLIVLEVSENPLLLPNVASQVNVPEIPPPVCPRATPDSDNDVIQSQEEKEADPPR
jgi:hypothetical protein